MDEWEYGKPGLVIDPSQVGDFPQGGPGRQQTRDAAGRAPCLPDPPGRLVLERVLTQGEEEYARRVTDDGRVWVRSTRSARLEIRRLAVRPRRQHVERTRDAPARGPGRDLEETTARSGLLDTAPEHSPDSTVIGGSEERWTVDLDGRLNATTLLRGVPEVHVAGRHRGRRRAARGAGRRRPG